MIELFLWFKEIRKALNEIENMARHAEISSEKAEDHKNHLESIRVLINKYLARLSIDNKNIYMKVNDDG